MELDKKSKVSIKGVHKNDAAVRVPGHHASSCLANHPVTLPPHPHPYLCCSPVPHSHDLDPEWLPSCYLPCPRVSQVIWILGVNHVASGMATYANVALLDPIQKMGLQVRGMSAEHGLACSSNCTTAPVSDHLWLPAPAASDPPSLLSQAFDDTELSGSADDLLLGGPFQSLSPYLFAVRFSRDCTGE